MKGCVILEISVAANSFGKEVTPVIRGGRTNSMVINLETSSCGSLVPGS